jgi:hypothetical protein
MGFELCDRVLWAEAFAASLPKLGWNGTEDSRILISLAISLISIIRNEE